jgi:hypothetical protein
MLPATKPTGVDLMHGSVRRTLVAVAATLAGVMLSQGNAVASAPHDVAVGTRLAARTDPAIQLIELDYTATVIVPGVARTKAFLSLYAKARGHAKAGRIPSDQQSMYKWILRTAGSDTGRYLKPAKQNLTFKNQPAGSYCTGWWMTPDGYMVTASHCVSASKAELRQQFGMNVLDAVDNAEVKGFLKSIMGVAQPDEELTKLARTMFGRFNAKNMRVTGLRKSIGVVHALPGGGMGSTSKITPLRLVAKGRDYPSEDFALLKMDGVRNLPTVSLGDDTDVQVGDELYINGFPGNVTNSQVFNGKSRLYPSLTEGAYNALRTTVFGVPYIQAQAPSYHGNSGGPVFSKAGRVIGTLIAGTGEDGVENHSYILPVSIIQKRLAAAGVKASESSTTRIYNSALDDFFANRYRAALPKFRKVRELYPEHPYVAQYISGTQKAIAAGKDRTSKIKAKPAAAQAPATDRSASGFLMPFVAGAGVVALIVVFIATVVVRRRRFARRRAAAVAPFSQGPPPAMTPYPPSIPPSIPSAYPHLVSSSAHGQPAPGRGDDPS